MTGQLSSNVGGSDSSALDWRLGLRGACDAEQQEARELDWHASGSGSHRGFRSTDALSFTIAQVVCPSF